MPRLQDIPTLPRAHYGVDVSWNMVEDMLTRWGETFEENGKVYGGIDLDPDYQRAHVWSREQQVAYVEYTLMGGEVGQLITWNNPTWNGSWRAPTELIDGKQRLEAVRAFMRDEVTAFGHRVSEYSDADLMLGGIRPAFRFQVCCLKTREEILQLYLNINAGGTPHTEEEIARARALLEKERQG